MSFRQRWRCALSPCSQWPPPGGLPGGVFARDSRFFFSFLVGALAAGEGAATEAAPLGAFGVVCACAPTPRQAPAMTSVARTPRDNESDMVTPGCDRRRLCRAVRRRIPAHHVS